VDNGGATTMNPGSLQWKNCKPFNYETKSLRPIHTFRKTVRHYGVNIPTISPEKRCKNATKMSHGSGDTAV
jgi:hypothetical protein